MDISHLRKPAVPEWYLVVTKEKVEEKDIGKQAAVLVAKLRPGEIRDSSKTAGFTGKRTQMVANEKAQWARLRKLAVKGWKNIFDGSTELAYTDENLELLDEKWAEFAAVWTEVAMNGNEGDILSKEEALGN